MSGFDTSAHKPDTVVHSPLAMTPELLDMILCLPSVQSTCLAHEQARRPYSELESRGG